MDNTIELKAAWNETIEKLKKKFSLLNTSDLIYVEGKQDESFGRLQLIFGKTTHEMNTFISNL